MATSRGEVVAAIEAARDEIQRIVWSTGDDAWSKPASEGWTAKQLLCHVAASANVAGFLLAMSRNPGANFGGENDDDAFNARQVALRESRPVREIADEATGYLAADVERVAAAPDDLLESHYAAPWGMEGLLADLIVDSLREHLMLHLRELAAAVE